MTKVIAVIILILALLWIAHSSDAARPPSEVLPPGPARIDIQSSLERTEKQGDVLVVNGTLWNKRITSRPIGSSIAYCPAPFDEIVSLCHVIFRFPKGYIVGIGIVSSGVYYRLSIVGGTGYYRNVGGQVVSTTLRAKPRWDRLIFSLKAF